MVDLPDKVLLVGSMNFDTVPEVFRTVGGKLGRRLRSIPDGEPGPRRQWCGWQTMLFESHADLELDPTVPADRLGVGHWFRIAEGSSPEDLHFGSLGYAHAAKASYLDLLDARKAGHIPERVKFQVCLPTPYAVATIFCPGRDVFEIERAYEKAMLREVEAVCASVPHDDLVIQWDVCQEMIAWDGQSDMFSPPGLGNVEEVLTPRVQRLADAVPGDVDVGIHLCYGDPQGKHLVEPKDAAKEVSFANAISAAVSRGVTYVHVPIPIERLDEGFFEPLSDLELAPGTDFYAGCVHPNGQETMRRRLELVGKYVDDFGIASECGIARARTPEITMRFLEAYLQNSREP